MLIKLDDHIDRCFFELIIFIQDTNQLAKNILSLNESLYANIAKWQDEIKSFRVNFCLF